MLRFHADPDAEWNVARAWFTWNGFLVQPLDGRGMGSTLKVRYEGIYGNTERLILVVKYWTEY